MRKKLITLVAGFILFSACGNNENHEKDIDYIVTIAKTMNRVSDKTNVLLNQLLNDTKKSAQDPNRKLSDSSVHAYTMAVNESISVLDSSIQVLSALIERDDSVELKQDFLNYLTGSKTLFQKSFPAVIELLKNGFSDTLLRQNGEFGKFMLEGASIQSSQEKMENKFDGFLNRHNISIEDLKKRSVKLPSGN